jgi:glucose dehydrogenase
VALLVVGVTACGGGGSTSSTTSTSAGQKSGSLVAPPAFTGAQLAAPDSSNWIDFGGNSFGERYSTLGTLDTTNAKSTSIAWETTLGEPKSQNVAGGLEYGGTYYIQSAQGDVFALNATTGASVWKYTGDGAGGGRGLAMGNGLIYAAEKDCYLVAIDAKTGKQVWRTPQLFKPALGFSFPGPVSYTPLNGGEVLVGTGGSDDGIRGFLVAVNAANGNLLWKRSFVPLHAGDPGYTSWGKPADLAHGGGGVWTEPVVDPATGYVIVATANASPYVNRPAGNDLYTASDVAVDAKTGKIVWGYQEVHHDEWDYDIPQSPTLFDMTYHGKVVHALDQPTKMGLNFVLNRVTGKPIIPTPETAVPQSSTQPGNSKTQPIPKGQAFAPSCAKRSTWTDVGGDGSFKGPDGNPITFGCIFTPLSATHYTVNGYHDVADWLPSTYDEKSKLLYICATENREKGYEAVPVATAKPVPGTSSETEVNGISGGDNAFQKVGDVVAMNPQTNTIAWRTKLPGTDACYAGLASTAGGLVFVGTQGGYFLAYNAMNGKLVWRSPKLDGTVGSSPIVYEAGGHEYVTLIVGGTSEGGSIAVQNDTVYAFALPSGAKTKITQLPTTTAATTTTTTAAKPPVVTGAAAAGAKLFTAAGCSSCHTLAAANATGTVGPDLDSLKPTQTQVDVQVTNGGRGMPAYQGRYSAKQISEIAAYVSKSATG